MKRLFFGFLVLMMALSFVPFSALAGDNDDAKLLDRYTESGKPSGMGMCDNMRSTLIHFSNPLYKEMIMLAPIAKLNLRVYVVKKESEDEYFIKEIISDSESKVRKLSAMDWAIEVMPLSYNFFHYIFFPESQNDCVSGKMTQ